MKITSASNKENQKGSHLLLILAVVAVIGIIGVLLLVFFTPKDSKYGHAWDFNPNNNQWHAVTSVPECPSQILTMSPTNVNAVESILWPGQYRGTNYKPHGGFRLPNKTQGDVVIQLPLDAYLVGATKYPQTGNNGITETQYILSFENPCGYVVTFDHLRVLDPEFTAIAEKGASENTESRFLTSAEKKFYKAGTILASRVGFENDGNTAFDFGVYDIRKPNAISQDTGWANLHRTFASQAYYGVCWIDLLPSVDKNHIMEILPRENEYKNTSDYCSYAPGGSSLKYNNGEPIEGDAVIQKRD